jgi:hypothetical protein
MPVTVPRMNDLFGRDVAVDGGALLMMSLVQRMSPRCDLRSAARFAFQVAGGCAAKDR